MSKIIVSPVKRWQGEVVISDPLTLPQALGMERASKWAAVNRDALKAQEITEFEFRSEVMRGLAPCVEAWKIPALAHLGTITADNFPATPSKAAAELFYWLMGEVMKLYEEDDDPNA